MTLLLGLAVSSSFKTFLLAQPMPATKPVSVAAFMIVFTSLLSDMVIFWNYFFNCNCDFDESSMWQCLLFVHNVCMHKYDYDSYHAFYMLLGSKKKVPRNIHIFLCELLEEEEEGERRFACMS